MRRIPAPLPLFVCLLLLPNCRSIESEAELRARNAAGVERLVEGGRALLEHGQPAEARALFEQAASLDGETLQTRMWVLRAWMDEGRSNDTLDAIDRLARSGHSGPGMDYLYGMAFARRAEGQLAEGVGDSSIEMNFLDANGLLERALRADGQRFRDAYPALARSAWFTQDLELARWAADQARLLYPEEPAVWQQRGRVLMSQFVLAQEASAWSPEAEELWSGAVASFRRALELYGSPTEPQAELELARTATELGDAWLWKDEASEASAAYATAISWSPDSMDYPRIYALLSSAPAGFRGALEQGAELLRAHSGETDPRAGKLFWWLGYARFEAADWTGAEEAFALALERAPGAANAWFYVSLARQYRKDSEGALAALRTGWELDPAAIVAAAGSAGGSLRAFEQLIGWCAENERNLDAALIAEMLAEAAPDEPRHWNNLGLFLRDEGERLELEASKEDAPAPDPALLADLYQRAFVAYARALELSPDDPQLLNDTALMLHYHLKRDLDRARSMYERAIELARERLAAPDLPAGDRERFETALQDANTNLEDLLDPERARARAEARRKEREEMEGAGSAENAPETPSEDSPD